MVSIFKLWNRFYNFTYHFLFKFNREMYWRELHSYGDLWDGVLTPSPASIVVKEGRKISLDVLKKSLTGKSVLEIGAGSNYYTKYMKNWDYDVTATDLAYEDENRYDVTSKPLEKTFDCIVAMGVLHHIIEDDKFKKGLQNIKKMAKQKIIIGVKIEKPKIKVANQRPLEAYSSILGDPIINEDAKYLNVLVFNAKK